MRQESNALAWRRARELNAYMKSRKVIQGDVFKKTIRYRCHKCGQVFRVGDTILVVLDIPVRSTQADLEQARQHGCYIVDEWLGLWCQGCADGGMNGKA